jgi:hypothetical protein
MDDPETLADVTTYDAGKARLERGEDESRLAHTP